MNPAYFSILPDWLTHLIQSGAATAASSPAIPQNADPTLSQTVDAGVTLGTDVAGSGISDVQDSVNAAVQGAADAAGSLNPFHGIGDFFSNLQASPLTWAVVVLVGLLLLLLLTKAVNEVI